MSIDLHGMALVAVVAAVTMLIRFSAVSGVWRRAAHAPVHHLPGRGAALRHYGYAGVVYCLRGVDLLGPHPRPAGTDRRRRGGGFALLEKEYLIKYCRRDGTVYGAGAGGVCVSVL